MDETIRHTILVVDDDRKLVEYICEYLERNGFATLRAHDGRKGIVHILEHRPAVVVLDLMMPGVDGVEVCRHVRPAYDGRILMLTGVDDDLDQVKAIGVGVDDYVVKPVRLKVLLARVRMLLRRSSTATADETSSLSAPALDGASTLRTDMRYGDLQICQGERNAYLAERSLNLTSSEFDLLWLFASHPEEVLSRDMLLRSLRGIDYDGANRSIDARVVGLRKKLADNRTTSINIVTVRGKGYAFVPFTQSGS